MNTLITGGAGFIGSHVVRHCLALGHEVVVLDDLSGGFRDHVPEDARFIQGSVTDSDLVQSICAEYSFDYIYHLAAYAAEGLSHFIRRFNYTNNLLGSINLINAAVNYGVKCFVFTSSIAVYGANQLPMTENMRPQPEDPYGIAKYAVELDLRAAHEMFGLDIITFRPHNVYGENQNIGDRYRNVIGIFMNQIMHEQPMTIFGNGTQSRAFSHIDDVAPIVARSVHVPEAYNEIYNIGADQPYTVNELAHAVADAMGVEANIRYLPARNEVQHAYPDHTKARRTFGPSTTVPLEEGIARMAAWAQRVGVRTGQTFSNIEIARKLPPSWQQ